MSIVNSVKGFVRTVLGIPPLTLPDCVDTDSIINYTIDGNSVQDGTPTPEAPVEVESVGAYDESTGKYKIPVVCGQLLDYVKYKKGYFINASGVETAQAGYKCTEDYIPVLPNTTYRIVCKGQANTSYSLTIPFYDNNKNFISRSTFGTFAEVPKIREFTTPNDCYYIRFSLPASPEYDVSLYNLGYTTNIYLDEPLRNLKSRSSGNIIYLDYVDFKNQKVIRQVGVKEYTENDSYTVYSNASLSFHGYYTRLNTMKVGDRQVGLCTYIQNKGTNGQIWFGVGNNIMYFSLPDIYNKGTDGTTRVQALIDWLASLDMPFLIYYPLATPTETPITLPKLPTIKGTTIYSIDTAIQPSNMEATYYSTSKE